ncbi:MAG: 3-oxoacyl-[acyl-carrier-protein] reductase [Acidobacteriota bacterium]|nr:3-oxoacyl-[acyl-carrier-protein] reductase [Acidobacteriota bacterium]
MPFQGKIAIVTGASQGIGEAVALELAGKGASVALVDIRRDGMETVAQAVRELGRPVSVHEADVAHPESAGRVIQEVLDAHGRIDFLVNNAGITRDTLLMRMKDEDWDAVMNVNLKGVFLFSRAVIRTLLANRSGRIVNIASVVGVMGNAGQANYAASKAGVIALSKSLAREVAARGITVNCIAPGYIQTAMTDRLPEDVKKAFLDIIPAKRFGLPREVAAAVSYLLSEDASYITGQVIHINGGMYM